MFKPLLLSSRSNWSSEFQILRPEYTINDHLKKQIAALYRKVQERVCPFTRSILRKHLNCQNSKQFYTELTAIIHVSGQNQAMHYVGDFCPYPISRAPIFYVLTLTTPFSSPSTFFFLSRKPTFDCFTHFTSFSLQSTYDLFPYVSVFLFTLLKFLFFQLPIHCSTHSTPFYFWVLCLYSRFILLKIPL